MNSTLCVKYQFDCRILNMVGLKQQDCILRLRGEPVCQKLGMIFENKVVQKLKLEKMFLQKMVSYMDILKLRKNPFTYLCKM